MIGGRGTTPKGVFAPGCRCVGTSGDPDVKIREGTAPLRHAARACGRGRWS